MLLKRIIYTCLSLVLTLQASANELDSLIKVYNNTSNDSLKARAAFDVGNYLEMYDADRAIVWGDKALTHARSYGHPMFEVLTLNYISSYSFTKGDYHQQIKLLFDALKLAEQYGFKEIQGKIMSNIGSGYMRLEDYEEGFKWLEKGLEIKRQYSSGESLAFSLAGMGTFYYESNNIDQAIVYFKQALELREKNNNVEHQAVLMGNLAECYIGLEKFNEGQQLLKRAIKLNRESDNFYGLCNNYHALSWLFEEANELSLALHYGDSALALADSNGFVEMTYEIVNSLASMFAANGDHEKAFKYKDKAHLLWQELFQAEAAENLAELTTIYETDKVEAENNLLKKNAEIDELTIEQHESEIRSKRLIIIGAVLGLVLLSALLFLLVRWNREKQKANKLLALQKSEIEAKKNEVEIQRDIVSQKNKEILDSIQYAKRIQAAILPPEKTIKSYLPNSFILYKPKDIVAGDFYWMESVVDEKGNSGVLFAAADCTGHGVPGAMVSVVCNNGLNRSVREKKILDPAEVLNSTREIVVKEFEKSEDEVRDGMDIALCSLFYSKDNSYAKLRYAGANNPLWVMRQGKGFDIKPSDDGRIIITDYEATHVLHIKADKQPIGKFPNPLTYNTYEIQLEKGDMIYLFSDGYADQFGGIGNNFSSKSQHMTRGKKMKLGNFKKLLANISNKDLDHQKLRLEDAFREWKGDLEQIDDVCVIGVRI